MYKVLFIYYSMFMLMLGMFALLAPFADPLWFIFSFIYVGFMPTLANIQEKLSEKAG